jgi:hypothetical protein
MGKIEGDNERKKVESDASSRRLAVTKTLCAMLYE